MRSSVKGLDKRLQDILLRPDFLEMNGLAKEIPVFIQTYNPADDDELRRVVQGTAQVLRQKGIRVKQLDLFELVLELLESEGWLQKILQREQTWSKSDLYDTLQNVADPTEALAPILQKKLEDDTQVSLITGSGRVYPFLRTHTILEAFQPAMVRHPMVIFFPGEYIQNADGSSYLQLLAPAPPASSKIPITALPTLITSAEPEHDHDHHQRAVRKTH